MKTKTLSHFSIDLCSLFKCWVISGYAFFALSKKSKQTKNKKKKSKIDTQSDYILLMHPMLGEKFLRQITKYKQMRIIPS